MRGALGTRPRLFGIWAAVAVSSPAVAAPPRAPAAPPAPALPAPQLSLKVTPGTGGGPWRLQIENTGEGPIRIPADPRLLVLELTPSATATDAPTAKKKKGPAAPAQLRCALPDDVRPSTDDGRELVIPSKRSWSLSFDPLFYCFGARERAALVAGTSVKPIFGWPARQAAGKAAKPVLGPPHAAAPVGASMGKVAPAKTIEADPFSLAEAVTVAMPSTAGEESTSTSVELSVPASLDVARGSEIGTTVTLKNVGDRAITLYYRPEMVLFTVSGPAGTVACGRPKQVMSPIRELFTTVGVKGRSDVGVLMTVTCPVGTFDEPGVYRVVPRIDLSGVSGRAIGVKSWDGTAVGKAPLLLRVRAARKFAAPPRPSLD